MGLGLGIGISLGRGGGLLDWSPTQLSGCILWLRPDMGITKDGSDRVSAWANQGTVGSSLDVAQAVAGNQPLWLATGGKNGGPALEFASARVDRLQKVYAMNQPRTWFVRGYVTSVLANQYFLDGTNENASVVRCNGASAAGLYAGAILTGGAMTNSVYCVIGGVFNGASSVINTNGTDAAGNAGASNATGITIGAAGVSFSAPLNGRIDQIVGYSRALDAAERAQVAAWMAAV